MIKQVNTLTELCTNKATKPAWQKRKKKIRNSISFFKNDDYEISVAFERYRNTLVEK